MKYNFFQVIIFLTDSVHDTAGVKIQVPQNTNNLSISQYYVGLQ